MSVCRSCGARVRWVRTYRGRRIPLDFEPNPRGNVVLVGGGDTPPIATVFRECQRENVPDDVPVFMPHHATCPDADDWRTR